MRKSKEDILEELQNCYDKHGKVNRRIFDEDDEFSSGKTVYNKFGSFAEALEVADLPHYHPQKKGKEKVICKNCGSEIEVYPYRLENTENFFCDGECQGEWLSENIFGEAHPLYKENSNWKNRMGSEWHKFREACLDRDNYKCRVCGISQAEHVEEHGRGLDVHHIEAREKFYKDENRSVDEANKMSNLITLCRKHHTQAENDEIKLPEV